MVLVALLWAFCGTAPPGWRLGLRRALVVVQSCSSNSAVNRSLPVGQSNYHIMSRTHLLTHSLSHALISSHPPFVMPGDCLSLSFPSLIVFSLTPPHPSLSSTSSSLPYVIQSHLSLSLSLTCSHSHAWAQPCSPFLHCSADSAHPSSSSSSSPSHHFSFLSPYAYFEALLLDLI